MRCVKQCLIVPSGNLITLTILPYVEKQLWSSFSKIRGVQLINILVPMSFSIAESPWDQTKIPSWASRPLPCLHVHWIVMKMLLHSLRWKPEPCKSLGVTNLQNKVVSPYRYAQCQRKYMPLLLWRYEAALGYRCIYSLYTDVYTPCI